MVNEPLTCSHKSNIVDLPARYPCYPTPAKCAVPLELPIRSCCNLNLNPRPAGVVIGAEIPARMGNGIPGADALWAEKGCRLRSQGRKQMRGCGQSHRPPGGVSCAMLPSPLVTAPTAEPFAAQQHPARQYRTRFNIQAESVW